MNFSFKFPTVKGIQAGRCYYISMVPLKLLARLFPAEDDIVLPEYRAQRRINTARIPEIRNYILDNRDSYVFSALSASIDGDFSFLPSEIASVGTLEVDMNAVFLINDGQHRKAAIEAALLEDSSLGEETISIVFFDDEGLTRSQQMFTDLNKHAVKTSNSLSTLYDSRNKTGIATTVVIDSIPFFQRFTDKEKDILGKNSSKLFTLNSMYKANQKILHNNSCGQNDQEFLVKYWSVLSENIQEWQDVYHRTLTKKDLRENYIVTLSITLNAFGRLGRVFYDDRELSMEDYLPQLQHINWLRSNEDWKYRAIREDGKVSNSDEASVLMCSKIKQLIGLPLSNEEQQKESKLKG